MTPDAPLIPPPPEELTALYELAQSGRLVEIRHAARRIADMDVRYRPFTEKFQPLIRAVDMAGIMTLVESLMPEKTHNELHDGTA